MIGDLTSPGFQSELDSGRPVVALVPVGSVEPHGPHLPLSTDTLISIGASRRAIPLLEAREIRALIAPAVPYGVTECAAALPGAVSIPAGALVGYLRAVIQGFLRSGLQHVCLVNNHLEPAHDQALRAALEGLEPGVASVACPLRRRWARTLSPEFKRGECHAGRYESALILAERPELVNERERTSLPEVKVSLSEQLMAGVNDFQEMGLADAYAGAPAEATTEEGEELMGLLAEMIATTVSEAILIPSS